MIASAHISNPSPFAVSGAFSGKLAKPSATTASQQPSGFAKALANANSQSQPAKPKAKISYPPSAALLSPQFAAPASAQPLNSIALAALGNFSSGVTGTEFSSAAAKADSSLAANLNQETPGQISDLPLGASAQSGPSAIPANTATPNASASAPQIPITPSELLASFLSVGTTSSNGASTTSGKTLPSAPVATPSDLIDPRLPSTASNALRNSGPAFESLASLSGQPSAFSPAELLRDVRGKLSGFAARPEAAQLPANTNQPAARGLTAPVNDAATLAGQRAISDARNTLAEQFGAKLQVALSAPAPTGASSPALNAHEVGTVTSGQPGNTSSNPQDTDQRKSGGETNDGSGETANSIASATTGDATDALKAGFLASAAASPVHGASDATSQFASVAAPSGTDSGANSATANSANPAKAAVPLPLPPPPTQPVFASDAVKASELYQHMDGSEMHIAMQTDLLGAVDLRATMHQSALTATISVQRSDVQSVLASELPSLQHALADRNLHVEQISILNNSVNDRNGSHGQQAQQQNQNSAKPGAFGTSGAAHAFASEDVTPERMNATGDGRNSNSGFGRLSIHV